MEHRHEPQRNGVIGISLLAGGITLLIFFVVGNGYFEEMRVKTDYELRLSAVNPALTELHSRENIDLEGYAWVDRDKGQVSIPIEEAMELVVEDYRKATEGK